ncbi:MAG TPA: hypothetical protein VMQ62_01660 [Dongiaceae bacterium]|nr:hypothetical protein [Dongiaceae bacterium]
MRTGHGARAGLAMPQSWRLAALVALLALGASTGAAVEPEGPLPVDPELYRQQVEITAGFTGADADRVARLLSPRLKTYVACHALAPEDGYYGADQLRLLLRRLFRGRETTGFKLVSTVTRRPDGQAVLQAIWSYRDAASATAQFHLAFTLAHQGNGWRLREIRDLS